MKIHVTANSTYEVSFSNARFEEPVLLRHRVDVSSRWEKLSFAVRFGHSLRTLCCFVRNSARNSYYVVDLLSRRLSIIPG